MPPCNRMDRGSRFSPRESGQTSSGCLVTRKGGKPSKVGRQMAATVRNAVVSLAGAPTPFPQRVTALRVYREV